MIRSPISPDLFNCKYFSFHFGLNFPWGWGDNFSISLFLLALVVLCITCGWRTRHYTSILQVSKCQRGTWFGIHVIRSIDLANVFFVPCSTSSSSATFQSLYTSLHKYNICDIFKIAIIHKKQIVYTQWIRHLFVFIR